MRGFDFDSARERYLQDVDRWRRMVQQCSTELLDYADGEVLIRCKLRPRFFGNYRYEIAQFASELAGSVHQLIPTVRGYEVRFELMELPFERELAIDQQTEGLPAVQLLARLKELSDQYYESHHYASISLSTIKSNRFAPNLGVYEIFKCTRSATPAMASWLRCVAVAPRQLEALRATGLWDQLGLGRSEVFVN